MSEITSDFKIINKNREVQYKNMTEIIEKYKAKESDQTNNLKTTRMRSIMNSYRLSESYKINSKVAYVGEQFPSEIVFAYNLVAWNTESLAILLSANLDLDEYLNLTQENSLSRDICSFIRGPYGVMLGNCYPTPDIILANDQPCDCLAKLEYMAGKLYDSPFYTLNTPINITEDSITYLANQMKDIIKRIEEVVKVEFEQEKFMKILEYSNEAREYYCKTAELLKTKKLPGVCRELHEIFGMNYFGLKENMMMCKTLYEEALEMVKNPHNEIKEKRVLWIGQTPNNSHEIIQHLEKELEVIYWAPFWDANLMKLDIERPFESIAERAILYHWNADRMRQNAIEVCDKYGISGIVIADIWGCRNMMGINSSMREMAKEKNLKYLTINLDLVDKKNYSISQVKNRIDAFLEIMR